MKTYILRIIMIAIILTFFITGNYIYAATDSNDYTCSLTFTPDKTTVKPGESITYDMKVSNINAGNGIVIADFFVSYDSELFDCKVRSYDEDKWLINGALNGKYTMSTYGAQPTKEDQTIAKIILTPKTGVTNNTYQVKITNISFTTDENDDSNIALTDATLNIKVESSTSMQENYTCNLTFTPDKTTVKPGESITYDMKVSNINAGNGIVIAEFYVSYNSELFDCTVRSYDQDKWLINGALNGKYTMSTYGAQPTKEDQTIAKIILTPKTGVTNNTYPVKITNISFTTDENDDSKISLTDTTLNIKVDSSQSTGGSTSGENTSGNDTSGGTSTAGETSGGETSSTGEGTSGTGTTGGDISGTTATDETKNESKTSSEKETSGTKKSNSSKTLPYSGDAETLLIILGIATLISLSVWFFVKYKRINI